MKIGLFFGSFNPIHTGHLIIANHIANYYVDKVWFIVSPHNPFKKADELLNANVRLSLVQLAIDEDERFQTLDIEFYLPVPSYTINTLKILSQKYPEHEFVIILGSDNFNQIENWHAANQIIKKYKFIIYERQGYSVPKNENIDYQLLKGSLLNIASTEIRNLIKTNKEFKYLVPEKVYEAIKENNYFK